MISEEKYKKTENILNRTIEFINNCDTKASIIITLVGILMTVLPTLFVGDVVRIKSDDVQICNKGYIVYVVIAGISIFLMILVMIMLIITLFARTQNKQRSNMYFGNICKKEKIEYEEEMRNIDNNELFLDLVQQIYINSIICAKKYKFFNVSLVLLLISVASILADFLIRLFWV